MTFLECTTIVSSFASPSEAGKNRLWPVRTTYERTVISISGRVGCHLRVLSTHLRIYSSTRGFASFQYRAVIRVPWFVLLSTRFNNIRWRREPMNAPNRQTPTLRFLKVSIGMEYTKVVETPSSSRRRMVPYGPTSQKETYKANGPKKSPHQLLRQHNLSPSLQHVDFQTQQVHFQK